MKDWNLAQWLYAYLLFWIIAVLTIKLIIYCFYIVLPLT